MFGNIDSKVGNIDSKVGNIDSKVENIDSKVGNSDSVWNSDYNLGKMDSKELNEFGDKIIHGLGLSDDDIRFFLSMEGEDELEKLYYVARKVRDHFFGNRVFLSGFVYFSTYCKNRCSFCYYNCQNEIKRYRLSLKEVKDYCAGLKGKGFHMVDLTMGEDPYFYEDTDRFVELVRTIKETLNLPIMISPGVMDNSTLLKLHENGANFFALYQETYDSDLYAKLRVGQSFEGRVSARNFAKEHGYCIEDGILTGIGNDLESTLISLRGMETSDPHMVRVMTFVPQEGTPLAAIPASSSLSELKIIAILRLMFPDRLIPASLDLEGIEGMVHRLNAGANVVTSIIASGSSLEGVVNYDRDLEARDRDIKSVIAKLKTMGMEPASQADFEKIISGKERTEPASFQGFGSKAGVPV